MQATEELRGVRVVRAGADRQEMRRYESDYIQAQLEGTDEVVKQPQRERIARFILRHHEKGSLRFLGLPGSRWEFEKMLSDERSGARFLGIECVWKVLEESRLHMPGRGFHYLEENLRIGSFYGYQSDAAQVLWARCSALLGIAGHDVGADRARRQWSCRYRKNTAAWLDFTSPLCDEVIRSLQNLDKYCDIERKSVPVAVTFMAAREPRYVRSSIEALSGMDGMTGCANVVRAALDASVFRRFKVKDAWEYQSTVPMCTVVGEYILR